MWLLPTVALLASIGAATRPDTIWLPEAETLFDSHFVHDLEQIKDLEAKHEFKLPLEVSANSKEFWILHNDDFITVYNKKANQVYMVTGKGLRWNSYERVLRAKVVDPRSKTKNNGIQVRFSPGRNPLKIL